MHGAKPRHTSGFTLVEVLVALAIVAFGLVAVFGQLSQSATAANRLREKTLAEWVALNAIAELRLSGEYPGVGKRSDDVEMAGQRWHYDIAVSKLEGDAFRRLDVSVSYSDDPQRPLTTVQAFVGQPLLAAGAGIPLPNNEGQPQSGPASGPVSDPVQPPDTGNGENGGTE